MNTHGSAATGWFRRLLIVFAIAGLSALAFSYLNRPARQPANPLPHDIQPVKGLGERQQGAPVLTGSVVTMSGAINEERWQHAANPAYSALPYSAPTFSPRPLPLKFLGKITEGDQILVLLYGGGRTLRVHGIGPLDDDYMVDVLEETYLVLRHVSLGESQIIELAARDPTVETGWAAENTPQD